MKIKGFHGWRSRDPNIKSELLNDAASRIESWVAIKI